MRTVGLTLALAIPLLSAGCAQHEVTAVLKDKTMVSGPACTFPRLAQMKLEKIDGLWTVPAKINEYNVRLAVDTGASDVIISVYAATAMDLSADWTKNDTAHVGLGGTMTSKPVQTQHFAVGGFDMLNEAVSVAMPPSIRMYRRHSSACWDGATWAHSTSKSTFPIGRWRSTAAVTAQPASCLGPSLIRFCL